MPDMSQSTASLAGGGTAVEKGHQEVALSPENLAHLKSIFQRQKKENDSFDAFLNGISSTDDIPSPDTTTLSAPISNYFISSSHNTYLTGNQLSSVASEEVYKNYLLRGCRCVEIDVWNGEHADGNDGKEGKGLRQRIKQKLHGRSHAKEDAHPEPEPEPEKDELAPPTPWKPNDEKEPEPRVLHGHTLTKEVPFRKVCEAIRDAAFVNSDLPVIISLELHTNLGQQQKMVDIMNETWRGLLIEPWAGDSATKLPSPDQLRKKILVKVKYTPPEAAMAEKAEDADATDDEKSTKPKKKKILDALTEMGIYTRAYHFKSFKSSEAKYPTHVFSLSEGALTEANATNKEALFAHNRDFLMRAFPKVQMVALNWQRCDKAVMMNEAMFAGSGGWVLKPASLYTNPGQDHVEQRPQSMDLEVEVLAAQDLPLPSGVHSPHSLKPYVKVMLHVESLDLQKSSVDGRRDSNDSASSDGTGGKLQYRLPTRRGIKPDFGGFSAKFEKAAVDDEALCFLRFKFMHDVDIKRDQLVAWACMRLDRVQSGVNIVKLFDSAGQKSNGFVLVNITKAFKPEAPRNMTLPIRER